MPDTLDSLYQSLLGRSKGAFHKLLPRATNAAPPLPAGAGPAVRGPQRALTAQARMRRAPCAILPIGLREPRLRHSLPPPLRRARGASAHGRKPP